MSLLQLEITPLHKLVFLTLAATQYLLFLTSVFLLGNYLAFGFSFIPYPSLATATSTESYYLWNALMAVTFCLQHIVMATLKYKVNWVRKWKYFALYDRYIFNVVSGIVLILVVINMKPSNIHLFTIPQWICLPLSIMGLLSFAAAFLVLGELMMMPFSVKTVFSSKILEITPY